jgi:hypothetical protein
MEREQLLLEEYKEVNANMRHFSNMRVAVLTISLAINGVLMQSLIPQQAPIIIIGLIVIGMISTLVFLIFENRVTFYYNFYRLRAKEIESTLSLSQNSRTIKKKIINATNATIFLYCTIIVFWIFLIIYKLQST